MLISADTDTKFNRNSLNSFGRETCGYAIDIFVKRLLKAVGLELI